LGCFGQYYPGHHYGFLRDLRFQLISARWS
jgi:hypothetical protein